MDNKKVKNILVVRNDRFGEFLLNIPAIRALKETFVEAKIIAVVEPYVRELAECIPYIDELILWGRDKHTAREKLCFIRKLCKKNIDIAVMLNPSKEFNFYTFFSGIPIRVGYSRKWGFLLTHKRKDKKYLGFKHEVEYNLELVGLTGATTQDKSLSLLVDMGCSKVLDIEKFDSLLALHPWTSDPIKQWSILNFQKLARKIIEDLGIKVIVIGGEKESPGGQELFGNFESGLIDITGKTTLKELAIILKRCRLLVSCDSGPVHLACAVGTPAVAIFRNDIPAKASRRWGPWGKGNVVIEKNRLSDITVDEVFNEIRRLLKR